LASRNRIGSCRDYWETNFAETTFSWKWSGSRRKSKSTKEKILYYDYLTLRLHPEERRKEE
jgi:hypothetical protein